MDQVAGEVVKWAVPALLGALVGLAGRAIRMLRRRGEREEAEAVAVREGVRSLLRCEIVRAHKEFVVRGEPMTLDDLEYLSKTYGAYHALGGNGTGTRLWEDIKATEIREA